MLVQLFLKPKVDQVDWVGRIKLLFLVEQLARVEPSLLDKMVDWDQRNAQQLQREVEVSLMEALHLELLRVIQLLAARFLMAAAVVVVLDMTCLTKELQNLG
jgi:sulfur relay (sulfurtransferase) DsrC/TusE family protein